MTIKASRLILPLALLAGCGTTSTSAPEDPSDVAEEVSEPEPPPASDYDEVEQPPLDEAGTEPADASESEADESVDAAPAEPAAKACAELDTSTCKVTVGCAWRDQDKTCVEE